MHSHYNQKKMKILRFFSLVISVILIGHYSFAQTPKLAALQNAFINNTEFRNACIGLYAININTNEELLNNNATTSFVPASILKLYTTSMAIEALGQYAHFTTTLAYSGAIEDSVLNGDIYIIGGGDPCLGTDRYSSIYGEDITDTWAHKVKDLGIKKINGNIISDISYFGDVPTPGKWVWEDLGAYYGTPGAAINYMDNTYKLYFQTGADKDTAVLVKVVPDDLKLIVTNEVTASASVTDDQSYIFLGKNENEIVIKGQLPCNKSEYIVKGSIQNPPLYVAQRVAHRLNYLGIRATGEAMVQSQKSDVELTTIHSVKSPALQTIVNYTNLVSCNLYAEVLRLQIMHRTGKNYEDYVRGSLSRNKIESYGFFSVDGSGVSHYNAITAKQTALLLKHINESKYGKEFISGLAEAGKTGTIKSYKCSKDGSMKLQAKTGSMTRVRSLAGIITNTKGEKIAFCIILNNYEAKGPRVRTLMDDFIKSVGTAK